MQVGGEVRHARAEGHAALDVVDIGAAAGGEAFALPARIGLVAAQQRGMVTSASGITLLYFAATLVPAATPPMTNSFMLISPCFSYM